MKWHTAKSNAFAENLILCSPFHTKKTFRSTYYCEIFSHGGPCFECYLDTYVFFERNKY